MTKHKMDIPFVFCVKVEGDTFTDSEVETQNLLI